MADNTLLLRVLLFYSLVWYAISWRPFAFHFTSCQSFANPKFISLIECSIREVNAGATISMDVKLAKDVGKITFDLLVLLPSSRQDLVLFNVNQMDGCVFLENSSPFPLIQIIRKEFMRYSNMPNKCPVSKGTAIKVRSLKLDPESFPSYVPETKFSVRVRMYERGEHLFNITTNGTCEHTRKFFKKRG